MDFFTVPTATFRVLFVLIILGHDRRKIVHFNVTEHPTAEWTAQQIVEAFCEGKVPRFLIRDRDGVYGLTFQVRVKALDIQEVVTAPRSPWQNPYSERVIGSLRRECLDYIVVLGEKHLRRIMRHYLSYYRSQDAFDVEKMRQGLVLCSRRTKEVWSKFRNWEACITGKTLGVSPAV